MMRKKRKEPKGTERQLTHVVSYSHTENTCSKNTSAKPGQEVSSSLGWLNVDGRRGGTYSLIWALTGRWCLDEGWEWWSSCEGVEEEDTESISGSDMGALRGVVESSLSFGGLLGGCEANKR
ncbi:hypothetical protein TRICI_001691 [Trichomonascus ciferrii]|uniref:Uncharacterized protein n=1 Tax=Trichomonascus ciferrii TaxID=44093 RepID=A0A642V8Y3_9ASCO|nr:hypothetical protein TRICI_001691 [Trichomonascus ciferrii]